MTNRCQQAISETGSRLENPPFNDGCDPQDLQSGSWTGSISRPPSSVSRTTIDELCHLSIRTLPISIDIGRVETVWRPRGDRVGRPRPPVNFYLGTNCLNYHISIAGFGLHRVFGQAQRFRRSYCGGTLGPFVLLLGQDRAVQIRPPQVRHIRRGQNHPGTSPGSHGPTSFAQTTGQIELLNLQFR